MKRLWLQVTQLTGQFWFLPALMTVAALILAELGIKLEEQKGVPPDWEFVYTGGEGGARSVLSAIASSSIGVAGTVFSITIAALSYAAGSMGPRLLDNFTRDRGNQTVLGIFIATFAFTLYSLRTVTSGEPSFVPHYNVTAALVLALACIAALVYYLAHVTGNINMTKVINLLHDDLCRSLLKATERRDPQPTLVRVSSIRWEEAPLLQSTGSGYLQYLDTDRLARLAEESDTVVRILVRPGDYVLTHSVVAAGWPVLPQGVMDCLTLGESRLKEQDLRYTVRQMAEVAARALSPGVNDPITAIDIIDRFGDALCRLHNRDWPDGIALAGGQVRVIWPTLSFGTLLDSMFNMIRQYGKGSPAVTLRMLEVFRTVGTCLETPERQAELRRHAALVYHDALAETPNDSDQRELTERYEACLATLRHAPPVES